MTIEEKAKDARERRATIKTFPKRIKALGLSETEFCRLAGMNYPSFSRIKSMKLKGVEYIAKRSTVEKIDAFLKTLEPSVPDAAEA